MICCNCNKCQALIGRSLIVTPYLKGFHTYCLRGPKSSEIKEMNGEKNMGDRDFQIKTFVSKRLLPQPFSVLTK